MLAFLNKGMHRHHYDAEYGRLHRIFDSNIDFVPGEFIYWDSTSGKYLKAVEGKCDLLVLHVDECGTWFEGVNSGEIQLNKFDLKGRLFIDKLGNLTNTKTLTCIGFIENGNLYMSIVNDTTIDSLGSSTGSAVASLGGNCPAVDPSTPYTWIKTQLSDGTIGYVPFFK